VAAFILRFREGWFGFGDWKAADRVVVLRPALRMADELALASSGMTIAFCAEVAALGSFVPGFSYARV
jgi:hypothetical protein